MRKDLLEKVGIVNLNDAYIVNIKRLTEMLTSSIFMLLVVVFVTLIIILSVILVNDCVLIHHLEVDSYVWGDRLLLEHNIPSEYLEYRVSDKYSLVLLRYYPLPDVPFREGTSVMRDKNKDEVVLDYLESLSNRFVYVLGQKNPNLLEKDGGDCQAVSIWVAQYLTAAGYKNGLLPLSSHVVNWVMISDEYYRVDVFYSGVTEASLSDIRRIEEAKR